MTREIRQIIEKYRYDRKLRVYSNKHFFDDNLRWSRINNNNDVERAYNYIKNSIDTYKEVYPLVYDDIIRLEKALGEYEIAVSKVLNCFDNPKCNFIYTADELQKLIDNLDEFEKSISEIKMRHACQD